MRWRAAMAGHLLAALVGASDAHAQKKSAPKAPATAEACASAAEHAQLLRMEGKLKDARAEFLSCAKVACPALVRRDCDRFAAEIEAALPSVTILVRDGSGNDVADATITIDGTRIEERVGQSVQLDPGPHAFHVVTSRGAIDKTVVVQEGDKNRRVELALAPAAPSPPPPPPPKPEEHETSLRPILGWSLIGLGVVGAGVGTYFAIAQAGSYSRGERCLPSEQPQCGIDAADTVDGQRLVSGIAFGVSAAALAGGIVLLLTGSPARAGEAARLRWAF